MMLFFINVCFDMDKFFRHFGNAVFSEEATISGQPGLRV